jgi:hypothetical protein
MLLEPQRMNTYEPFSLKTPFNKVADIGKGVGGKVVDTGKGVGGGVVDVGKGVGGGVVDIGKDVGGKVVDVGKGVGGKVADVGKKVGGTLVSFGKSVGKIFGPMFKKLLEFLMMIFKNWKLALCIAITCCVCYLTMPFIMPLLNFFK